MTSAPSRHRSPLTRRRFAARLAATAGLAPGMALLTSCARAAGPVPARAIPAFVAPGEPAPAASSSAATATAVLAGGCFWGVQAVYQYLHGVLNAVSGYAGGERSTAVYEAVGTGRTGHAEAVQITYDPRRVSFAQLLHVFFSVAHDPTQLNRQGPDVGPQYRSAIFPVDAAQARIARAYIQQLNQARVFPAAIVTKIEPDRPFYPAEDYHQDFLVRNPRHPYIVMHDLPKLIELQRLFPQGYRAEPMLVADSRR